ncbi:MAG: DUF1552 domain-containing protein [Akkermansiaceae bacterium]|nr:DUF1552 domain-containing protein [Akkermansiaceae bacterium]MCF7732447.1 DUF1552 domain-containing protein [Akkermansiaceae bacterium]
MIHSSRRQLLRTLGLSAAALPFTGILRAADPPPAPRRRIVFVFSPNGTVPDEFWPDSPGPDFTFKRILSPLTEFRDRTLLLRGISNKVRGDGDGHMRGMGCMLTGIELLPGNIQGGSDTPAGWASGISFDQELKNHLQSNPATRTRVGSLSLGVAVPNRADPWTRWSYSGANQPITPLDDPSRVFQTLYGGIKDKKTLGSVLDGVAAELRDFAAKAPPADRELLERHLTHVRELERKLQQTDAAPMRHPVPPPDPRLELVNDRIPEISRAQIELLVGAFANDDTRVATIQYTHSVGQARMTWLGIPDAHHSLSHDPDHAKESHEKLVKINQWFAGEIAHLAKRLASIPEADGQGTLLDHTTILWTNELGKGNSHSQDNLPFLLLGGGLGFKTGRVLDLGGIPHNRLWLAIAHALGHPLTTFGKPELCHDGPLPLA